MSKRPLKLENYGISKELYNELRWFCLQYPAKVKRLNTLRNGFNDFRLSDVPQGTDVSKPTEKRALRALRIREDIEAIEQAAIMVDAELYQYILRNVTEGVRFEELDVPCGRRQFFEARRVFFMCLADSKEKS